MKFRTYITQQQKARKEDPSAQAGETTRIAILRDLADSAQVSLALLRLLDGGGKIGQYMKAKAISKATSGKVSIAELCDHDLP